MDFEAQVREVKSKCKAEEGNRDLRLTKEEADTLILAYQAGDYEAGGLLYGVMEHLINSIAFDVGGSLMHGESRSDFLMNCKEVFFNCMEKYDCSQEGKFEAYLYKSILNECVGFKKKLSRAGREYGLDSQEVQEGRTFGGRNEVEIPELVNSGVETEIENLMLTPEVMAVLEKLGSDHKKVITQHIMEGKSFSQIGQEEKKDKSTIQSRYKKAIKELRTLLDGGHKDVTVNADGVDYRMIKSYRVWKAELEKRAGQLDFETELLPYLSEEYKYIFCNVLNNYNGETLDNITKRLNKSGRYVTLAIRSIFKKMDTIIYRKKTIEQFYERYGGVKGKEDLETFLNEKQRTILNEYMLSINPDAAGFIAKNYPEEYSRLLHKFVQQVLNTFDGIMERKQNCESFINRYGGYNYLVYIFGASLPEEHLQVMKDTMMDYHYTSLVDYSTAMGRSRSFAGTVQERILDKLMYLKNNGKIPDTPSGASWGE